ncbi:hypothetical protein LTS10_004477 [Elasticomyces elasticus]|nr:hypothetical protein LTS10_004477 [Elasticomyces elasticus]
MELAVPPHSHLLYRLRRLLRVSRMRDAAQDTELVENTATEIPELATACKSGSSARGYSSWATQAQGVPGPAPVPAPELPLPAPEPPAYSATSAIPAGLSYGLIQPPPNPSPTPTQVTNHDQDFQATESTDSSSSAAPSSEESQRTQVAEDNRSYRGEGSNENEVQRTSLERQELRSNLQE